MRRVSGDPHDVRRTKKTYSGEKSPYWEFLETHSRRVDGGIVEDARANPDVLADEGEFISDAKADQFEVLEVLIQTATPKQRHILQLLSEGRTYLQIAEALGIQLSTVQDAVERLRKKARRIQNER